MDKQTFTPINHHLMQAYLNWAWENNLRPDIVVDNNHLNDMVLAGMTTSDGIVILNLSVDAVRELNIDHNGVSFVARFKGTPVYLNIPLFAIQGVIIRAVGGQDQYVPLLPMVPPGMVAESVEETPTPTPEPVVRKPNANPPILKRVK